jgi:predicted class III extradiol MEMO1 family dioxygenase
MLFIFGGCIAAAAKKSGRRVALITSGDLSHKLTEDGPYGFDPAGPEFDKFILDCILSRDIRRLTGVDEITLDKAAQCGYYGLVMLYGAVVYATFGADAYATSGAADAAEYVKIGAADAALPNGLPQPALLSYEGTFGVGYAIARIM